MEKKKEAYLGDRPLSSLSEIEKLRLYAATRALLAFIADQIDKVQVAEPN